MLSTDRQEFETQCATLCAGFNVPPTKERIEAFWIGLKNMSLLQFVRVVEHALSEDGPDKFPTPKGMWALHRAAKSHPANADQPARPSDPDHLLYFANRMFLRHLVNRSGLGSTGTFKPGYGMVDCKASPELLAARKAVRDLVEWFSVGVREGDPDATPIAFVELYIKALGRVSPIDKRSLDGWAEMCKHPDAAIPFEPHMGRELPAYQQRLPELA